MTVGDDGGRGLEQLPVTGDPVRLGQPVEEMSMIGLVPMVDQG